MAAYMPMPTQTMTFPVFWTPTTAMAHASAPVISRLSASPEITRATRKRRERWVGDRARDNVETQIDRAGGNRRGSAEQHAEFRAAVSHRLPANGRVSSVTSD